MNEKDLFTIGVGNHEKSTGMNFLKTINEIYSKEEFRQSILKDLERNSFSTTIYHYMGGDHMPSERFVVPKTSLVERWHAPTNRSHYIYSQEWAEFAAMELLLFLDLSEEQRLKHITEANKLLTRRSERFEEQKRKEEEEKRKAIRFSNLKKKVADIYKELRSARLFMSEEQKNLLKIVADDDDEYVPFNLEEAEEDEERMEKIVLLFSQDLRAQLLAKGNESLRLFVMKSIAKEAGTNG